VLPLVDFHQIGVDENRVSLGRTGMRIDLGAIAKGYIVDRAVRFLKDRGVTAGLVEAGGDLRLFGKPPHRENWRIGILHPRKPNQSLFGVLDVDSGSVTTSGDYERTFTEDGKRYHHLIDPATGYPADECISVTIIAETAMLADAWATAVFIMGPERGMALLESQAGVEGMMILKAEDGLAYRATPAFDEIFHLQE
jgi:thiamine biosynthesis lipoprotein